MQSGLELFPFTILATHLPGVQVRGEHTEILEIFALVFSGESAPLRSLWLIELEPILQATP